MSSPTAGAMRSRPPPPPRPRPKRLPPRRVLLRLPPRRVLLRERTPRPPPWPRRSPPKARKSESSRLKRWTKLPCRSVALLASKSLRCSVVLSSAYHQDLEF
jgi:hypothetical protein